MRMIGFSHAESTGPGRRFPCRTSSYARGAVTRTPATPWPSASGMRRTLDGGRFGGGLVPAQQPVVEAGGERGLDHLEIRRDVEVAGHEEAVMPHVQDLVDAAGAMGI